MTNLSKRCDLVWQERAATVARDWLAGDEPAPVDLPELKAEQVA